MKKPERELEFALGSSRFFLKGMQRESHLFNVAIAFSLLEIESNHPTLVVSGAHDAIAAPRLGKQIAEKISGSKFAELPDAAHGIPITHCDWLNDRLD